MPKFSAYMRGEKGIQGETGQASLLDGIVDGVHNLPDESTLQSNKNYVYYVKENDGIHLYVSEGGSQWEDLGVATAGFSTTQYASASTKEWFPGVQPDVTIIPHDAQQTTGLKSFDFHFDIPESQPAGFSTNQPTSVSTLDWNEPATVEIISNENTPDYDKSFTFNFGIPHGREAGFSTTQRASVSTLSWTSNATVSITTDENSPFYEKVYNFDFGIPQGEPAGFSTLSATVHILDHLDNPTFEIEEGGTNREKDLTFKLGIPAAHPAGFSTVSATSYDLEWDVDPEVSITTNGNDWEKNFDFSFGIPHGRPAGFSTEMGVSVTTLPSTSNATVSVTPDATSPDYAKKFDFEFGIPNGVPGGFGTISVSTVQILPANPAEVSITTSGPESAKNFDFLFKIPQGLKGEQGDALGTYLGLNFTSTDTTSTEAIYWDNNNVIHINRGENKKLPIYILNTDNNNIAATFEITENEILHQADSKFDGILYLIAASNIPRFELNSFTSIPYGEEPSVDLYYKVEGDPSLISLDFKLPKGQPGPGITDISLDSSYISETTNRYIITYSDNNTSYFEVQKGEKGDTGAQGPQGIQGVKGDKGNKGDTGVGISEIYKSGTNGLQDTYTIKYTDNSTTTFIITNGAKGDTGDQGRSIDSIAFSSSSGLQDTYTINYSDNTNSTFIVTNGAQGPQGLVGPQGPKGDSALAIQNVNITQLQEGESNPYASVSTDQQGNVTIDFHLPPGATGVGISSINKESSSGIIDNYTINYNNGTSTSFQITNGKGINSIDFNSTSNVGNIYTINYNDSTSSTIIAPIGPQGIQGEQGNIGTTGVGISSIEYINSEGLQDTYRINLTNNNYFDFNITNGAVVGDIRSIIYTTTDPGPNTPLTTGNIILVYDDGE